MLYINKSNGQDSLYRLFLECTLVHNKGGLLLPEKDDSLSGRFEPIYSHWGMSLCNQGGTASKTPIFIGAFSLL